MYNYRSSQYSKQNNYYKKPFHKTKGFYFLILIIIAVGAFFYWSITKTPPEETSEQKITDQEFVPQLSGRITFVQGTLEIRQPESEWQQAGTDYQVQAGDMVQTADDSKAIIELPDQSIIRLSENAQIKFTELGMADIVIEQIKGSVFHRVSNKSTAIYRVNNRDAEFTALGTAFNLLASTNLSILTVTESRVKTKIYDGETIVNMRTIDSGSQATVNPTKDTDSMIDVDDIEASELQADDWYAWNLQQDQEKEFFLGIFEETITLAITEPENTEMEIDDDKITIKGTTDAKAEIFIAGKELDNNNGQFETEVSLEPGENEIEIVVKLGKNKNKKLLLVTSTKQKQIITLEGKVDDGTVELTWQSENLDQEDFKNYKIVQAQEENPEYPDATYHTAEADENSDSWEDLSNGTYYFRVCSLDNENKCLVYSNNLELTIGNNSAPSGTISLTAGKSGNNIELSWTLSSELEAEQGFKSIISDSADPVYPGNSSHSLSSNQRNDTWKQLSAGTYHFRVCLLKDNECLIYSNNASATVSSEDTGSISLSGISAMNKIRLTWEINNFTPNNGFKVFMSENPGINPPLGQHHLITDSSETSDSWSDLESGKTYYFMICENSGSICSNEISVEF